MYKIKSEASKLLALQIGTKYAVDNNMERAKFWLKQAMPSPEASLILAQLYARSRAVRASVAALEFLGFALRHAVKLDAVSRQEVQILLADLMKRNLQAHGMHLPPSSFRDELDRFRASPQSAFNR